MGRKKSLQGTDDWDLIGNSPAKQQRHTLKYGLPLSILRTT